MIDSISVRISVRRTPRVARHFNAWGFAGALLHIAALSLLFAVPAAAHDGHGENAESAFAAVWHHYEALWQTLADDSGEGLAEHAEGIREAADRITADFSLEEAGLIQDADADEAAEFFSDIAKTALYLGSTTDLATAREAFYEISKTMVRLNELRAGDKLKVVYCAMAKKSWLQREEKIVNPYHGKSMGGCGEVVSS